MTAMIQKWSINSIPAFFAFGIGMCIFYHGCGLATGQQPGQQPGFKAIDPLVPSAGLARSTEQDMTNSCRVTFCTNDLTRVLIHDGTGKLVITARSLEIRAGRIGDPPVVVCKVYDGIFEPSGTPTKTWRLAELRFVDSIDFQKLIDQGAAQKADMPVTAKPSGLPAGVDLKDIVPLIPEEKVKAPVQAPPPAAVGPPAPAPSGKK